jgi:hypothetical protein
MGDGSVCFLILLLVAYCFEGRVVAWLVPWAWAGGFAVVSGLLGRWVRELFRDGSTMGESLGSEERAGLEEGAGSEQRD